MKNLLSALLLTILAVSSAAAGSQETPAIFSKLNAKVGSWAEYSVESKKGEKTKMKGRYRMSVVGKKGAALWIEQKMTVEIPKPKKDEAIGIMKFLMSKEGIEKAYIKSADGVMDMSRMMGSASRKKQKMIDKAKMTKVGVETIKVAAGKFKATHYTLEDGKNTGDIWVKSGTGPYGMIKQVHRTGKMIMTVELLSSGNDATSEVDESTARSGFDAAMDRPSRTKQRRSRKKTSVDSDEDDAPKKPSIGGFFKNALKKKVGLSED